MKLNHPHIQFLVDNIDLEEQAQAKRFELNENQNLKNLKREGLAIHPIKVNRKSYGFAEYPEFSFKISFPLENNFFKDGASIELFAENEKPIQGILLQLDGKQGECRIYAPDFPDWIDEVNLGIKLSPDTKTNDIQKQVLQQLDASKEAPAAAFFHYFDTKNDTFLPQATAHPFTPIEKLNASQNRAVEQILGSNPISIVHGPPGTGKTTTLLAAISELVKKGEKILVTAPSNTAVDHVMMQLIKQNIACLRIGNQSKMQAAILPHTIEGKLTNESEAKQIKKLRIQANEYRKMAYQYKRNFGKAERDQRKLLQLEVKNIRKEIKAISRFFADKCIEKASVICGTPIAIYDAKLENQHFETLIIDEAGQCLQSMAWVAFRPVNRLVLAGDHLQLPPTVISEKAMKNGFNISFLEYAIRQHPHTILLDTQYRMRKSIAAFSSAYFYEGKLQSPIHKADVGEHFHFFDTAGTGFEEEANENGSLSNLGELEMIRNYLENEQIDLTTCALISPYAGQVELAKSMFDKELRISTIDSFQGQEMETIILSLVRSNSENQIGFLKDYRRLNVALTRAKEKLIVIGDSVTLGTDPFFAAFIAHTEKTESYRSAWELMR